MNNKVPEIPLHWLSIFVTLVIDWLWLAAEIPAMVTGIGLVVTCLGSGATCWLAVSLVQRYLDRDNWGEAIAKGLVLGVVGGIPYPVSGTVLGGPLLAWAGLQSLTDKYDSRIRAGQ